MKTLFEQRPDLTCYAKIAALQLGYVAGQIELTSACSQRCLYCDSWRAHAKGTIRGRLSLPTIMVLIQQLNEIKTFEHLSFTGGDPQDWKDTENSNLGFEHLLGFLILQKLKFSLQVNTALIHPINIPLWRKVLSRVRVSLDSVNQETYYKLRGDNRDPEEIIQRMEELAHPGLATMTCVSDGNIHEVPEIIARLNRMEHPPRKAMFLAVLGQEPKIGYWKHYAELKAIPSPLVETSFQEDVAQVREFCDSPEAETLPCRVGGITFHVKCNGDVHECCLAGGGEAIESHSEMAIGNIHRDTLSSIQKRYIPKYHYKKGSICSKVCQYKQLLVNRLAHEASKITLTMP